MWRQSGSDERLVETRLETNKNIEGTTLWKRLLSRRWSKKNCSSVVLHTLTTHPCKPVKRSTPQRIL
ncbi:hypothetical protein CISIN_1g035360mg [Citrus sinensis]|uniref:Uncharacterized protein n=1 Tax=Citrus sinensis TaxID=2711 RepID=A0A067EGG9_CITSI|nr:hypothetical protein CISIN_1g035360mg [Citrus sinensis]